MMSDFSINWAAVLVAVFCNMVLGSLWYGPFFGKIWMKSMGMDPNLPRTPEMKKKGQKALMGMVVAAFVMCWVMAHMVKFTAAVDWMEGAQTGFWLWLGFQLTLIMTFVLFENRKKETALINAGYQLAALCMTGALLAAWA